MKLPPSLRALPDEAMVPWGWVKEELGYVEVEDEDQDTIDYWCERVTEHIGCSCHAPAERLLAAAEELEE